MVKVPATPEGLPAIEQLIGEGISINITLLFSQEVYREVARPISPGLEKYVAKGGDPSHVASVASFFVSRIDTAVDKQLDEKIARANDPGEKERLSALKGKVAIANAKLAYQDYKRLFAGARWEKLAAKGAKPQRLLWASTGTKNKDYRRALCRGADRSRHRQHRAAGDAGCIPRPRQKPGQPRGEYRGRAPRAGRARKSASRSTPSPTNWSRTASSCSPTPPTSSRAAVAQARHRSAAASTARSCALGDGIKKAVEKSTEEWRRVSDDPPPVAEGQVGLDR